MNVTETEMQAAMTAVADVGPLGMVRWLHERMEGAKSVAARSEDGHERGDHLADAAHFAVAIGIIAAAYPVKLPGMNASTKRR